MYVNVLGMLLDMHPKTRKFNIGVLVKMIVFDTHFTYQLIYDERYFDNLYSNVAWRCLVRDYYGGDVYDYNIRLVKNRWKKSSRIKSRLLMILVSPCNHSIYFATFTFNDRYIDLPYLTLRTYISKFLKFNFEEYICNVDYGSLNGRLHFHAVVRCRGDPPQSPYGFCKYQKIFNDIENLGMCSNYLNKLTNHSTKEKGRVLYSKNLRHEILYND